MTPLGEGSAAALQRIATVELARYLRMLRRGPQNPGVERLAAAIEIELRVRALLATTPGIGTTHGAPAAERL